MGARSQKREDELGVEGELVAETGFRIGAWRRGEEGESGWEAEISAETVFSEGRAVGRSFGPE